jgi:hypothetical protein
MRTLPSISTPNLALKSRSRPLRSVEAMNFSVEIAVICLRGRLAGRSRRKAQRFACSETLYNRKSERGMQGRGGGFYL